MENEKKNSRYLFVLLQVAKSRKCAVTELTRIRCGSVGSVGVDTNVGVDLGLRREARRCRRRTRRRRLSATSRVCTAILALPWRTSGAQGLCNSKQNFLPKIVQVQSMEIISQEYNKYDVFYIILFGGYGKWEEIVTCKRYKCLLVLWWTDGDSHLYQYSKEEEGIV